MFTDVYGYRKFVHGLCTSTILNNPGVHSVLRARFNNGIHGLSIEMKFEIQVPQENFMTFEMM